MRAPQDPVAAAQSTGVFAIVMAVVALPMSILGRAGVLFMIGYLICAGLLIAGGIQLRQRRAAGRALVLSGGIGLLAFLGFQVAVQLPRAWRKGWDDAYWIAIPITGLIGAVVLLILVMRPVVSAALLAPAPPPPFPPQGYGR
ncbi:hypothetical protein SAMN05192558_11316 [Actinokineospora alba]|uniref:Uncharacterized protein n=2 Tax=Actinokineospora alba TaxID=504798 RepID=A0A1H0V583_9PSEU|nr:hypothetical protein C8E96_0950 [Actinokineospora alba]SDH63046.1 hypothetical protein SAMN05421871_101770 [Actinokineospora alba]SDP73493.1 hypothetical protein SAMN05192558_11316 [Actinokineospora alba]